MAKIQAPQQIGKQAKALFATLLNEIGEKQHVRIDKSNGTFYPVTLERISEIRREATGKRFLLSVAHYYKQEGDLMRDPEIVFLVIDGRKNPGDFDDLLVYPVEYTQDNLGMYQRLIELEDMKPRRFVPNQQASAASFCTMWFKNIRYQQELTTVKESAENKPVNKFKAYERKANKIAADMGFKNCYEAIGSARKDEFYNRCKKEIGE